MKNKGLGDVIENITTKTGIKGIVEFLEDKLDFNCGCDERKDKLNKLFPNRKLECLTEDEYNYLTKFDFNQNQLFPEDQKKLLLIYNRIFHENKQATTCSACWKNMLNDIKFLYQNYDK